MNDWNFTLPCATSPSEDSCTVFDREGDTMLITNSPVSSMLLNASLGFRLLAAVRRLCRASAGYRRFKRTKPRIVVGSYSRPF